MRGLFFKIFAIFWLAQSLIFIISTALIVGQRFPTHTTVFDALNSNLENNGKMAMQEYEAGGCAGFAANAGRNEPGGADLLEESGQSVCQTADAPVLHEAGVSLRGRVEGREIEGHSVWFVPVSTSGGKQLVYVWFLPASQIKQPSRSRDLLHFAFPQLPVAIAVGGLTTFVLVLLFTRPLARLRKAARELAEGNLGARVVEGGSGTLRRHSDEFQGLVHDFNHMAERLEMLVGAQKLLLRDVSHELRSPLARLSVALELAREDAEPELGEDVESAKNAELGKHLERIEREAGKLNLLIGQLLTLSSLEAKESTSTFETVSLNELCEQMLPDAEYEAQQRPCSVVLEQDAECSICGNGQLLYRAVENVVRNAIRYTAPGSQVEIRVRRGVGESAAAVIEVADRGPGIPEAELEDIFRPFYRVDRARSSSTGGFGVGLAIAERAVRLHGGTVRASNRREGGTMVEFVFPLG